MLVGPADGDDIEGSAGMVMQDVIQGARLGPRNATSARSPRCRFGVALIAGFGGVAALLGASLVA